MGFRIKIKSRRLTMYHSENTILNDQKENALIDFLGICKCNHKCSGEGRGGDRNRGAAPVKTVL